jgi:proteasome accessory factor C
MDKFEKIYELHRVLFSRRTPITTRDLAERLECSEQTAKRIARTLRNNFNAPLIYSRERNGWYYDREQGEGMFELPGLWFNQAELYALLTLTRLLGDLEPGLLTEYLSPFTQRMEKLFQHRRLGLRDIDGRIRLLSMAHRSTGPCFDTVASATLQRKRLKLRYHARSSDEITQRELSPQRLTHYRDNWYLDAWCHLRGGLRRFSIDRIDQAHILDSAAEEIPEQKLDDYYSSAYGIFAGPANKKAVLRFSPHRARWVADEQWHPEQQGRFLEDGSYELTIPYGDEQELIMDILKYSPDVEVIAPDTLRERVKQRLQQALEQLK